MNNVKKLFLIIALHSYSFVNAQYYRGTGEVIDLVALSKGNRKLKFKKEVFQIYLQVFRLKNICPHTVTKDSIVFV